MAVVVDLLQGSDADNIIPDEVVMRGTLRALTHEHMMLMKRRIEEVGCQGVTSHEHMMGTVSQLMAGY
jgi:metal-dependent amidase/aminoacylase/carboxypeptidase family protein